MGTRTRCETARLWSLALAVMGTRTRCETARETALLFIRVYACGYTRMFIFYTRMCMCMNAYVYVHIRYVHIRVYLCTYTRIYAYTSIITTKRHTRLKQFVATQQFVTTCLVSIYIYIYIYTYKIHIYI